MGLGNMLVLVLLDSKVVMHLSDCLRKKMETDCLVIEVFGMEES